MIGTVDIKKMHTATQREQNARQRIRWPRQSKEEDSKLCKRLLLLLEEEQESR